MAKAGPLAERQLHCQHAPYAQAGSRYSGQKGGSRACFIARKGSLPSSKLLRQSTEAAEAFPLVPLYALFLPRFCIACSSVRPNLRLFRPHIRELRLVGWPPIASSLSITKAVFARGLLVAVGEAPPAMASVTLSFGGNNERL